MAKLAPSNTSNYILVVNSLPRCVFVVVGACIAIRTRALTPDRLQSAPIMFSPPRGTNASFLAEMSFGSFGQCQGTLK